MDYGMRLDGGGVYFEHAQDAIDFEAEDFAGALDDDDARVVAAGRGRMPQLPADVDDGDHRPAQRDDPDDRWIGIRHLRGVARRDDLDEVLDRNRVLLAGDDEREQLDLIGRGDFGFAFDEAFAALAGGSFEFVEFVGRGCRVS